MEAVQKSNGWSVQSSMPEAFIRLCCMEPKDAANGFERITRSHRRTLVCRFEYEGRGYYYKEYFFPGACKLVKDLFRGSWSRRAARIHVQLEEAGFTVAHVAAIGKKGWRRFLVTEELAGHNKFAPYYRTLCDDDRVGLLAALGKEIGRLHHHGFSHGDLRWGNVPMVRTETGYEFSFLDNERTKRYRRGLPVWLRKKNLVQVCLSGRVNKFLEKEWAAFFDAYCAENPSVAKQRYRWEKRIFSKTVKRMRRSS